VSPSPHFLPQYFPPIFVPRNRASSDGFFLFRISAWNWAWVDPLDPFRSAAEGERNLFHFQTPLQSVERYEPTAHGSRPCLGLWWSPTLLTLRSTSPFPGGPCAILIAPMDTSAGERFSFPPVVFKLENFFFSPPFR